MADNTIMEATMRRELATALNVKPEELQLEKSFLAQGGDSLSAIHFMSKCRSLGIEADIVDVLQSKTLSEVVAELAAKHASSESASSDGGEHSGTDDTSLSSSGVLDYQDVTAKLHQPSDAELVRFAELKAAASESFGDIANIGPCSSMQNRILISQAVNADAYQCSFTVTAQARDGGPLPVSKMERHWREVVARHPSLRTTFVESEQRPGLFDQIVWDKAEPAITILQNADQVKEARPGHSINTEIAHHTYLSQTSPTEIMLRLNISHAIVDGRSAGVLLRDLCNAFDGEISPVESLRHADFALAEESTDEGSEDFWRNYLRGAEESYLPGAVNNKPKTGLRTLQGRLEIPELETRKFCDQHGVTLVNVCQLAWGLTLRYFALKEDVSYSYVTSGRQTNLEGMQEAVGLFISSLVLRLDFANNAKVIDLLKGANVDVLRAMLHDKGLRKRNSKWGNSILSLQRAWQAESTAEDPLRLNVLERLSPTDYDHSVSVEIGNDAISVDYSIWKSTTDEADAERILSTFLKAMNFVLTRPDADFNDMDVLGSTDAKALQAVNGISPTPSSSCIHTLVSERTVQQPDAMAVCAWDGTMTYRELDQAANKLASHLAGLGVGPEVAVGMCMDKSRFSSISTLAILKAGGVVVPLSTAQPLARIGLVLNDTQIKTVIVDAGQLQRLSEAGFAGLHFINLSTEFMNDLAAPAESNTICPIVNSSSGAWIVFTSGSTGNPKGVVLQHSALCSSILAHGSAFGVTSQSRVLQFASHTFDVMIQETFTTLVQGGCVCVPSEQDRLNNLEDFILRTEVNFLSLTSTVAGVLSPARLPAIETVILMGEPVKPAVLDMWMRDASVFESYAPSECSIYATCSPEPMKDLKLAPVLGAPLSSCFWVVDPKDYNHLVPLGAPGELLIEGPLLARGYLNDIEKTNKSFIVDPGFIGRYNLGENRRMYRTGDLVRQNSNGTYSTLGRQGMQIKIRGQRIEIGEVEYHITQHSPGMQAIIVLSQNELDNGKLVATFSLKSEKATAYNSSEVAVSQTIDKSAAMRIASDLQQYLAQHIPDYMIPRAWVPLAQMPVNPSGKVDRRAISMWINTLTDEEIESFSEAEQAETDNDAPATDTEQKIREVWSTVLNIPIARINYRRSFLSYGGDSITAMQVVSACRKRGLTLSVRNVLQSRAISDLALQALSAVMDGPAEVSDAPFGLSPAQQMYFTDIAAEGARSDGPYRYNQAVCLQLREAMPQAKVAHAIEALVAKHAMLRARFHKSEGEDWQQHIETQLVDSYSFHRHAVDDESAAEDVIQQVQGSLNIEQGPVFAAELVEMSDRTVIVLIAHHLVIDLVSWRLVMQDLEHLLLTGSTDPVYSMPFSKWSALLTEKAQERTRDGTSVASPDTTSSWTYWGLELGQYMSSDQVFATAQLDEKTTDLLLSSEVNSTLRTTPADILLAGLLLAFRDAFPDRASPTVFLEGHGRDSLPDCDLSETVGWFTTMSALDTSDNATSNILTLLKQVKEFRKNTTNDHALEFANQYLTPGKLTSHSEGAREIMFNYQGQFQQLARADGILSLDRLQGGLQDPQSRTSSIGDNVKMLAALNVEIAIEAGRTNINVGFSKSSPRQGAIRQLVHEYSRVLGAAMHELLQTSPMATPSDFPLAKLSSETDLAMVQEQCLLPAGITSWQGVEDILPCSPIQQGILLSQMRSPSTYWLKQTCRVLPAEESKSVDTTRLADAWQTILRHHSIMRTIFAATPLHQDRFYQIVLASPEANIHHITCPDSELQQCFEQHSLKDDQPGRPLHQFLIVTTTSGSVYGHFEISHALVDASSIQLLVEMLLKAYENPSASAIPESKYSTYVSYLEGRSEQESLQYWQDLLSSAEPCNLQSDQNLGELAHEDVDSHPSMVTSVLPDASALYDFCQKHGVTAANVFQLAWTLVLSSRVDTRDQMSFGYLSSGRDIPIDGVDTLVGPMINMMICHFDIASMLSMTPSEAVQSVQERFLEGFDHQRASLATIQHSLQRSLFNTTISYRRAMMDNNSKQAGSLRLEKVEDKESTEYDFSLNVLASGSSIEVDMQYWSAVASRGAAERILAQLKHVVGLLCTNAVARLGDLELLSTEDEMEIKTKNTIAPAAFEECLHAETQRIVSLQPDATAVHAWDGSMTYRELDDAANRLGSHLVAHFGVRPETKVGICMDKSRWAVIAMYATLKAGGVVLPLSTQQPHARLRMILEDTAAPIILVDSKQLERLSDLHSCLVKIDQELLESLPTNPEVVSSEVRPTNSAWIVYTSGSTGTPKGVVLEHRALCTSLKAHGKAFGLSTESRVLQFAAHTFDVTIQEMFTTMFFGGTICIPSELDRLNNLENTIVSLGVNHLSLTSTVSGLLEPSNIPAVTTLILIGEPVNPLVLEKWMYRAKVLNAYGPSECSIQVTTSSRPFAHRKQAPVLGKPLASNFWIVDSRDGNLDRLCPIGSAGELLIEGPLLAREYLNDPEKTARSFVVDPGFVGRYGMSTGRRMYRTGDLVRQNDDGTYTNLGRSDTQIKIRGQRVEIGEVEYHIARHASQVHAAIVLSQRGSLDDKKLVAAFSLPNSNGYNSEAVEAVHDADKSAAMLVASDIQYDLSQHVPQYMIPRTWIPLSKLPVGPTGKVDRLGITKYINSLSAEALLSYSEFDQVKAEEEDSPATTVERQIRKIWSHVLNVPIAHITYRRSFLSYGGDSITAMQVVSECRKLGIGLTVRDILQSHAIADLSLVAQTRDSSKQLSTAIPDEPFDLSPAQRMYFRDIALDGLRSQGDCHFNQSVCFQLQQPVQQQSNVARAVDAVVAKHPMLRARFEAKSGAAKGWQQRIEKQVAGSYRFQAHVVPDDEAARAAMRTSQRSLDVKDGPVFAAEFLQAPDRQLLFLTAHHLVIDLMSWRIIAQDLEHLLQGGTTSISSSLPFPSWCGAVLQEASQHTPKGTSESSLGTGNVSPWDYWGLRHGEYFWEDQMFVSAQADPHATSLLIGSANDPLRTSPEDILLSALYASFRKVFADRPSPAVSIEGHGRGGEITDCDVSETVGWFTSIARLDLSNHAATDGSAISLVKQLKDARKMDGQKQAYNFASRYLDDEHVHADPIEVLFNYHGQFQQLERDDGFLRLDRLHQPGAQSETSANGGKVRMQAAFNVEVSIENGRAKIDIGFSKQSRKRDLIQQWASEYTHAIASTVLELSSTKPMPTASDFPLAHLSNPDLGMVGERFLVPAGLTWEDIEDVLPCSPVQQGILLSQLKSPTTYVLKETCRILPGPNTTSGCVDTARLSAAWTKVMQQHSIMRTIFTGALLHQERFYQVVLRSPEANIRTVECASDADVQECVQQNATSQTQLGQPQHQLLIVTTAQEGHVYAHFEISHALLDASSVQILVDGLLKAYEGSSTLPKSSYSTYISFLERHSEETDLLYWQGLLATAEPCNLQMNHSPFAKAPEVDTKPVVTEALQDTSKLQSFCKAHNVTIANVFQVAWSLVLSSRIGSDQVSFGYLSSGRDVPMDGADTLMGPMINMMICHVAMDHGITPAQAVQNMQNRSLEGFEHQRASLAAIQHTLHPSRQNLFNTTVSYRRDAAAASGPQSIRLERMDASESTEYQYNLSINAGDSGIELVLLYQPEGASAQAARRLLCQLRHVVDTLCNSTNANASLRELDLVSPEDAQVIKNSNARVPSAEETCIHSLLQEVIARQPKAEAVCAWDGSLSYEALDDAANRLAYHLSIIGVGPEVMVGMCMDKSKWAVVAMLAILRAGGVVLPLSPQQPHARLEIILKDTKAPIILVDAVQRERLADMGPALIQVDAALLDKLPASSGLVCPQVSTTNSAWVVYTSGSTGQPKGVVLQHRALCTSIQSHGQAFGVDTQSRVLHFASHTFDVTIQEVFTTLCRGGTVCTPSEEQRLNQLEQAILSMRINFLSLTSTVAGLLDPEKLPAIKTVVLMGEPVKPAVLDMWKHRTVLESYAPSECSIYATCSPESMTSHKQVSVLGVPLASCFWVADPTDYNRLCPIGAPGELLIEGPLLARGYLNDEAKTAKSFVVDPEFITHYGLQDTKARRMYRTGDIVRQNEDGSYTTMGRRDMQVKVFGQRLDVGEIEYWVVRISPQIRTAAVMLATRKEGTLAAAVDFTDEALAGNKGDVNGVLQPSAELFELFTRVRNGLMDVLPRYMVPDLFIPFAELPLNTSGKLDRKSIQASLTALSDQGKIDEYIQSNAVKEEVSTETEQQLQSLWAKVLGRASNTIGANDNFFHAGGDSMMAMRLVQLSRGATFSLTVADIFEFPRLTDLARVLDGSSTDDAGRLYNKDPSPFSLWSELPSEQSDRLQPLLAQVAERCAVAAQDIQDVYPCTSLQERLMLSTTRRQTAFVSRRLFRLEDSIDLDRFQAAWQQVVKAAPILRTRILLGQSSGSIQVVVDEAASWHTGNALDSYLDKDRAMGMAEGRPLMRLGLVVAPHGKRYFVWTAHHCVYDGYSMQVLFGSVATAYQQQELPPMVPFSRFIAYAGSADNEKTAKYWQDQLSGELAAGFPPLPHANYQPRPTQQRTRQLQLGQSTSSVPLAALLRAAWALLIAQYAGLDDVIFAAALSGRNAPVAGMMDMLAPTVTTVPLRIQVDLHTAVHDFLEKVQQQATEMIPFEHTGLQRIKEAVPDVTPALDAHHVFVVQPSSGADESGAFPGMVSEPLKAEAFDSSALTVECIIGNDPSQVTVDVRFDQAVIPVRTMDRMLQSFTSIAAELAQAEKNVRLGDVQTLSATDLQHIRAKNGKLPPKPEGCLLDGFLTMALEQPFAEAVCAGDGSLTYAELDRWSARLAHHLVATGVKPEEMVGVSMAKGKWAVVAMLAILRAGATVVPLGIQLPLSRVGVIVRDASIRHVLADEERTARLAGMDTDLLTIESSFMNDLASSLLEPSTTPQTKPSDGAFVIYTSGSTGVPKGVLLEHGALAWSVQAHGTAFGLNASSRVLQFAAYTFDVSIQEVFTTLCFGGTICVPSEDERVNSLESFIAATGVNFMSLTSTVAEFLDPNTIPAVETLALLGEPVTHAVLDLWADHAAVLNAYGPAECSIHSTCSPPLVNRKHASMIGRPTAGCFWVVDPRDHNRLCPIGVPGELLIEGPQLAREYLNDAVKTKDAFVVDPGFVKQYDFGSGRRMYRTGDIVKQNEDGTYNMLGRRDRQVKIRGQRVELAEIEYWVLRSLPHVRRAAVTLVRKGVARREGTLTAAVEFDKDSYGGTVEDSSNGLLASSDALQDIFEQLRGKLREVLPRYMVPELFIPMEALPLNNSGKLDRKAIQQVLTGMTDEAFESHRAKRATPAQVLPGIAQQLQKMWSTILGKPVDTIGPEDNFFTLGADSMSAMQLVSAVRSAGMELSVAQVFQNPVLRNLCQCIEATSNTANSSEFKGTGVEVDLATQKAIKDVMLDRQVGHIFEATDFQSLSMAEHTVGNAGLVLYMTMAFDRKVDKSAVRAAYQHAVDTTEMLRATFVQHEGRTYQAILDDFNGPFEEVVSSGTLADCCESLIANERRGALAFGEPPLKAWFVEGATSDNFIIRLSHAQYDGLSLPLLLQQLKGNNSDDSSRSPRQMSYYMNALQSLDKTSAVEYWRRLLDQSIMPTLPTRPTPAQQRMTGAAITSVIPTIKNRRTGTTPATYVKAAWAMALARLSGQTDVVFAHLVSGRSVPVKGVEEVNGPCVNLIPIRVDTANEWKKVLDQVQAQQVSTLPHEHLGFDTIFKECTTWPLDTNQRSRFSTIIQYQNQPDTYHSSTLHGADCRIAYEATPANITDVWVTVEPKGDELHIFAGYFEEIIESATVQRLVGYLVEDLKAMQEGVAI